jgi:hypothetical protein
MAILEGSAAPALTWVKIAGDLPSGTSRSQTAAFSARSMPAALRYSIAGERVAHVLISIKADHRFEMPQYRHLLSSKGVGP